MEGHILDSIDMKHPEQAKEQGQKDFLGPGRGREKLFLLGGRKIS